MHERSRPALSAPGPARVKIRHVPGLDGLRGLAVLGVLLFHANGLLRGGYLGVDLFFVLSGFLITSLLVEEHRSTGRIELRTFWIRRARRLMPALLALMPAVALHAFFLATPSELTRIRGDAIATLAYVANWRAIVAQQSYWEMFAAPSPLEHTWSLAIEEQFYVVWPLVVAAVLALFRGRVRALMVVCLTLGLASAVAMGLLYEGGNTTRVYLGTDTRGTAILLGAALAASGLAREEASPSRAMMALNAFGILSAVGLAVAWSRLDGQSSFLYRGGFWATELAALVVVACTVRAPLGPVARALSVRPLRWLGEVSYGVYLWHWPLYVVLTEERLNVGGLALLSVRLVATFAVALVSYRFLERPIRERGIPWGRPALVVPSACALSLGVVLLATRGGAAPPTAGIAPSIASMAPPKGMPPIDAFLPASALPSNAVRALVLGDSVAISLGIHMYWSRRGGDPYILQRAVGDCSILEDIAPVRSFGGEPHGHGNCAESWVNDVKELHPDVAVVMLGGAFLATVKLEDRWQSVCDPGWHDAYARRLTELLEALAPHVAQRLLVLTPYPVGKWDTPAIREKVDCYTGVLREAARKGGAQTIDLMAHVCPGGVCTLTSDDQPVRLDGLHFGGAGSTEAARWMLSEVRRLTEAGRAH